MLINLPKLETIVKNHPEWKDIIGLEEKFENISTGAYLHNGFNSGMWIAAAYDKDFDVWYKGKPEAPELVIGQVSYDESGNPQKDSMIPHSYLEFDIDRMAHTENIILAKSGVCDFPDQILAWPEMADALANPDRMYTVVFTRLDKHLEPDWGGWRWHKWGEYVGTQDPQCEYLYNEPEIETIYLYTIHDVTNLRNLP